jgi:hypothetical protein
VLALRAAGLTFAQIARATGQRSAGAAGKDYARALAARRAEARAAGGLDEALELERLDGLTRSAHTVMTQAQRDGDGELVLQAVDRLLRVSKRRGEVLGWAAGAGGDAIGEGSGWTQGGLDDLARRRAERRRRSSDPHPL